MPDMLYALALVTTGYTLAGLIDMIKFRKNISLVFLYVILAAIIILTAFLIGGALAGSGWSGFIRMNDSPYLILLLTMATGFFGAMLSAGANTRYKIKLGFLFAIGTIALTVSFGLIVGVLLEKKWGGLITGLIENQWLDLKPNAFFENLTLGLAVGVGIGILAGLGANWIIRRRKQAEPEPAPDEALGSITPPASPG